MIEDELKTGEVVTTGDALEIVNDMQKHITAANSDVIRVESCHFLIPECCKEGWESCPHVIKKEKPRRNNIGL